MTPEEKQKLIDAARNRDSHALLVAFGVRKDDVVPKKEDGIPVLTEVVGEGNGAGQSIGQQMKKIAAEKGRKMLASVITGWIK
jgi:hypothetical protein